MKRCLSTVSAGSFTEEKEAGKLTGEYQVKERAVASLWHCHFASCGLAIASLLTIWRDNTRNGRIYKVLFLQFFIILVRLACDLLSRTDRALKHLAEGANSTRESQGSGGRRVLAPA